MDINEVKLIDVRTERLGVRVGLEEKAELRLVLKQIEGEIKDRGRSGSKVACGF